jgi:hypothetical protein
MPFWVIEFFFWLSLNNGSVSGGDQKYLVTKKKGGACNIIFEKNSPPQCPLG